MRGGALGTRKQKTTSLSPWASPRGCVSSCPPSARRQAASIGARPVLRRFPGMDRHLVRRSVDGYEPLHLPHLPPLAADVLRDGDRVLRDDTGTAMFLFSPREAVATPLEGSGDSEGEEHFLLEQRSLGPVPELDHLIALASFGLTEDPPPAERPRTDQPVPSVDGQPDLLRGSLTRSLNVRPPGGGRCFFSLRSHCVLARRRQRFTISEAHWPSYPFPLMACTASCRVSILARLTSANCWPACCSLRCCNASSPSLESTRRFRGPCALLGPWPRVCPICT